MSAVEFVRWIAYMDAEQIGPGFDQVRHAKLLATTMNAPRFGKRDNEAFVPGDFYDGDPWAEPNDESRPDLTFEQIQAQAAGMFRSA